MEPDNPVIQLCIAGTQAEFKGQAARARALYQAAWDAAQDDYEACIAAHYVAHLQENPQDIFYWNNLALEKAGAVETERVREFLPSLFVNMGKSYELLGDQAEAAHYYELAAGLGCVHQAE